MKTNTVVKLPVTPYNGMWIDCVNNNLIGVLSQLDPSFDELPSALAMNYSLYVPQDLGVAIPESFFTEGLFTLRLNYQLPDLSKWLQWKDVPLPTPEQLVAVIRELIDQGWYTFVELDRFYFRQGTEYYKKHRIHPSFIYGYDSNERKFLLIEDCVQQGNFNYYELTFDEIRQAFESALAGESSRLFCYQVIADADKRFVTEKRTIIENLQRMLDDREEPVQPSWQALGIRHMNGIASIKRFADMIEEVYPRNRVWDTHQLVAITLPMQMQKRNVQLLDVLEQHGFLNPAHKILLQQEFVELSETWEKYRHRMFRYIILSEDNPDYEVGPDYFARLKLALYDIAAKEEHVTRFLLETLL